MKKLMVLAVAVLVVGMLGSTPVLAGKGRGAGKPSGSTTTATLSVSPSGLKAGGEEYTVTGAGFKPNQTVAFNVADPGCCLAFNGWADGGGNVSFSRLTGYAGTYTISAYQWDGRKYTLMASVSFSVATP